MPKYYSVHLQNPNKSCSGTISSYVHIRLMMLDHWVGVALNSGSLGQNNVTLVIKINNIIKRGEIYE